MSNASLKQSATDSQRNGFMKDSFGFKMSKKVAELTQVVHMLFTRNHEREVELDGLKASYEEEIVRITKQAQAKTEKLEFLLRDTTRQRQRDVEQAADSTASLLKETQEKMEIMKQDLIEERSQSLKYRELLTQAQKELDRVRHGSTGVTESLEQTTFILSEKENELTKLKSLHRKLQEQYKATERDNESLKQSYRNSEDRWNESQNTVLRLNKSLEESNKQLDDLVKKLAQAEEESKAVKRELKKRSQGKNNNIHRPPGTSSSGLRHYDNKSEEIENLRREIERLRMELSNREGNFNRVFAKFQPVVVSPEAQKTQTNRMMMVTPSFSEGDASGRRQFSVGSSRSSATDPSVFPRSTGNSQLVNFSALNNSHSKMSKSYSQSLDQPRLSSSSKNTHFRLVYTK